MDLNRRSFSGLLIVGAIQAAGRTDGPAVEEDVFSAANRERRLRRLPALSWNDRLAAVARRHSERMARLRFFSHTDPERGDLADRLEAAGVAYQACGENLYRQSGMPDSASGAITAWLRSRGHRSNLLSSLYRKTGVGVAVGSGGEYTITQLYLD